MVSIILTYCLKGVYLTMNNNIYYCDIEHFGKEKGNYICLSFSLKNDLKYIVNNKLNDKELKSELTKLPTI